MAVSTHQSHNIPWQLLADQLWAEEVSINGSITTRLHFKEDVSQERFIRHFCRKFAATICEFADSEAIKFSTDDFGPARGSRKVYQDSLCVSSSSILVRGKYQDLGYWKQRFQSRTHNEDGDLANVIKELFNLDQLDAILYLARNGIQLHKLATITYSNFFHYGIRCTLESSLTLYVVFNLCLAMDLVKDDHKQWPSMLRRQMEEVLRGHDYDAHLRVPAEWLKLINSEQNQYQFWAGWKSQMKFLFRCLYQYEVMSRELQRPVKWEVEVEHVLGFLTWPPRYVPLHLEYLDDRSCSNSQNKTNSEVCKI